MRRAPLLLRWKAKRCKCVCHTPSCWEQSRFDWWHPDETPTHHDKPCCSRFVGTVNRRVRGWPRFV